MRPAAFFDLDRTVMSGASPFYFGKAALKRGFYSRRAMLRDARKVLLFKFRGASDEDSASTRDWILSNVAGRRSDEMLPLVPEVLGPILQRVYPTIYDRILAHERDGVATYLCSASPIEIVQRVAAALHMTGGALATTAEVGPDGVYTGELTGPFCYGEGKAVAMRAEAVAMDLDLTASWAYSDSVSDLPMMEAVGRPVAVNPDKALARIASEREWETLRVEPRHGLRMVVAGILTVLGAGLASWIAIRLRASHDPSGELSRRGGRETRREIAADPAVRSRGPRLAGWSAFHQHRGSHRSSDRSALEL